MIFYGKNLDVVNLSNLKLYEEYLSHLSLNDLRRIFRKYVNVSDIDFDLVFDTKTFYINKIIDSFEQKALF